ncbi:MAG: hypothetical protein QXU59_00685 [Pyrobaculum sp.]
MYPNYIHVVGRRMGMEAFDLSVRDAEIAGTVRIAYRTYVGNLSGRYYSAEIVYVYKRQSVGRRYEILF